MKQKIAIALSKIFRIFSPYAEEKAKDLLEEVYVAMIHRRSVKTAEKYRGQNQLKLNVGCGPYKKDGFVNIDFSANADIRMDLRHDIPLPSASCALIFSEHFLEHLSYPEGVDKFLKHANQLLQSGGKMLISVPDTRWPLEEYVMGRGEYLKACHDNDWHPESCVTFMDHINYHFRQRCIGRRESHFECHRYSYDFETMKTALERNGFTLVKERSYDPSLDSPHRRLGSLFVEAFK